MHSCSVSSKRLKNFKILDVLYQMLIAAWNSKCMPDGGGSSIVLLLHETFTAELHRDKSSGCFIKLPKT